MQPRTEEEREARPRPRVCRRLFADEVDPADPLDHSDRDNMLNQINEQINRDLDEACKKYNFDFRNEVPMEGNWVWERMDHGETEAPLQRLDDPGETPTPSGETSHQPTPQRPQACPQEGAPGL